MISPTQPVYIKRSHVLLSEESRIAFRSAYLETMRNPPFGKGICFCGCNETAPTAKNNHYRLGMLKGDYFAYIKDHRKRKSHLEYIEEDRGWKTFCWIWQRGTSQCTLGFCYGSAKHHVTGKYVQAHREMYERLCKPIPDGYHIDHLCRVHLCVNPDHLEPVPPCINIRRGINTRLSDEYVREIIKLRSLGMSTRRLGEKYGVHNSHISRICSGKKWRGMGQG